MNKPNGYFKFRADDVLKLRIARVALFYKDASEMVRTRVLVHIQNEERDLAIESREGKVRPAERIYETYDDLPAESQAKYDEFTRELTRLSAEGTKGVKSPAKRKVGSLTDVEWVSHSILGISSCGKLSPTVSEVLDTVKLPKGKYPDDAFCVYASGDSMNKAKLPDGQRNIKNGDVVICRSLDHESAVVGKIVVVIDHGDTAIKRLCEDRHGKYVAPESSNKKHEAYRLPESAEVQAVVIGKL